MLCYPKSMSTDSLFSEIDEDLRREKLEKFWKQNRTYIIAAIVLSLIGSTAYTIWQNKQTTAHEKATATLAGALQNLKDDNRAEIETKLVEFAQSAPAGTGALAQLYAAGVVQNTDKSADGLTHLRALAERKDVKPIYRDLAKLLLVQSRLDSDDATLLQNELSPLKGDGQPWRYSAREMSALLSLKQGDTDSARATFEKLQSDTDAPTGIRERAQRILSTLPAAPTP